MTRVLCAFSGLEFTVEHFPIYLTQKESYHPIFDVPQKRLWKYYKKWEAGELTKTDSFLLFLAMLRSTELIEWRHAIQQAPNTDKIIYNNMEQLFSVVGKITGIKHPKFSIPRFAITSDTCNLNNIKYWLNLWESSYEDFCNGLQEQTQRSELARKEIILERLIKNTAIKQERYAHILADWAELAGEFPQFSVKVSGEEITCAEYWKSIIKKCYHSEAVLSIPSTDLQELIDHCENNIDAGSIYAFNLFQCLREGKDKQQSFFGIGDLLSLSTANPGFRILDPNTSIEDANIAVLIDTAPLELPKRINYPSELAYMKAKFKWEAAQKYRKNEEMPL